MIDRTQDEIVKAWQGDKTKPIVSIRCTAYNHEKYISQCLDGFLIQETTFPFEIVIHDDASTDKTVSIIQEYEKKYPRIIKPIYETENQYSKGNGALARILDSHMWGKYIAFCEGDDYWTHPNKLQAQYDALEAHPELGICFGRVQFVDSNGNAVGHIAPDNIDYANNIITYLDYANLEFKKGSWSFHTSSFFLRTSIYMQYVLERQGDLYGEFPYGDMAIIHYFLLHSSGYLVPKIIGCYRMFSGGYNSYVLTHPEFAVVQEKKLISALTKFNIFLNYKYDNQIKSRIFRGQVKIAKIENNRKQLKYLYRSEVFKKIGTKKEKVYAFIELYCPNCYDLLKKIKHSCVSSYIRRLWARFKDIIFK